jgi:predicted lipoprotein with Yx(FWY)xxD motif
MRNYLALAGLAAFAALAVPASAAAPGQASVVVHASSYGPALFDGRGFALYAFTHDPHDQSTCAGECAKKWPPYIVSSRPIAGDGANDTLLGTIRLSDGRLQATYGGRPLYYFVGDTKPGEELCQNVSAFGGLWLIVAPDGQVIR